ncbi:hypothetical protein AWZ03_001077 [Drosophila navojoa]|uniref:Uncharacterized protein n=1 Tax=Drosophila navojoa TaxID=7232 RepID=A0A484BVZ6_DRONA|nr:hypothetical protein AWZ03_001077 [Drosophila navojoa]
MGNGERGTEPGSGLEAHFNFLTHFKFQLAINVMQSNTLNHCELANNANTNKRTANNHSEPQRQTPAASHQPQIVAQVEPEVHSVAHDYRLPFESHEQHQQHQQLLHSHQQTQRRELGQMTDSRWPAAVATASKHSSYFSSQSRQDDGKKSFSSRDFREQQPKTKDAQAALAMPAASTQLVPSCSCSRSRCPRPCPSEW